MSSRVVWCWVVFFLYSLIVAGVGFWSWRRNRTKHQDGDFEFWLASRDLSGWQLGVSLASGWLMLGWISFGMGQIYGYGATGLWILPIPWLVLCVLIIIFVPFFRRVASISLPQSIGKRFGPGARYLTAFLSCLVFMCWTGAELVIVKKLAAPSWGLGENGNLVLVIFIVPIIVYTVLGGFRAIVNTDILQFAIMAVFILVLGGWAVNQAVNAAPEGVIAALQNVTPPYSAKGQALNINFLGFLFPVVLLVGYLPGWLVEQDLAVRIQAVSTTRKARLGAILGGLLITTFIIVIPSVIAFCALVVFNPSDPELVKQVGGSFDVIILAFIRQMPGWLTGLMFLGIVACQMSTVDTFSNVTAMPVAFDIIEPLFMKGAAKKQVMLMSKIVSACAIFAGLGYALAADSLGDVYYLSSGVLSAAIAVPALAVFWRRANTVGVLAGSIAGTLATVLAYIFEYHYLQTDPAEVNYYLKVLPGWVHGCYGYMYIGIGVVFAVIFLVGGSLLTPAPAGKQLKEVSTNPIDDPDAFEKECSPEI